jgi:hypothetical protein
VSMCWRGEVMCFVFWGVARYWPWRRRGDALGLVESRGSVCYDLD